MKKYILNIPKFLEHEWKYFEEEKEYVRNKRNGERERHTFIQGYYKATINKKEVIIMEEKEWKYNGVYTNNATIKVSVNYDTILLEDCMFSHQIHKLYYAIVEDCKKIEIDKIFGKGYIIEEEKIEEEHKPRVTLKIKEDK